MISFARVCRFTPAMPHREWKALLSIVAAAGFVIGIFPRGRFHYVHMFGCALMVGALWFLGNVFTIELRDAGKSRAVLLVQLVLQLTVLPYAVSYALEADSRQALQKLAIIGLFVSLSLATRALRQAALETAFHVSKVSASAARVRDPNGATADGGFLGRSQKMT